MDRSNSGNSENTAKAEPEIEVTPGMVEAGGEVIFALREKITAWSLAEEVYRAMEMARTLGATRGR